MSSPLRIALFQSSGRPGDVEHNLRLLDETASRAADAGAELLITSELFVTGYAIDADLSRLAEPADGPIAGTVADIAARHRLAVVYGYPERAADRLYNSAGVVGATGRPLAHYRKTHLYGDFERAWFAAGDQPSVQVEVGGLRVAIAICYDVEFPEAARGHALAGADLLVVPTAQMRPFEFVAESVVPVRAFENQMYVAYVNRCGPEGDFEFVGLSCLAGPDGVVAARAGRSEELLLADVDTDALTASRATNPYLADRRPDLYAGLT